MPLKSTARIKMNPNARCLKVYPTAKTQKRIADLKTVGIELSKAQAIHLARLLLVAAQDWDGIGITAYRLTQRKSYGTYQLTVTGRDD